MPLVCVCVCVCVRVRACVRACVCVNLSGNMQDVQLISTTKASLLMLTPWHPTVTTMQVMAMNSILCQ